MNALTCWVQNTKTFHVGNPRTRPVQHKLIGSSRPLLLAQTEVKGEELTLLVGLTRDGQALTAARLVDDAPGEPESVPPGSALRPLTALAAS